MIIIITSYNYTRGCVPMYPDKSLHLEKLKTESKIKKPMHPPDLLIRLYKPIPGCTGCISYCLCILLKPLTIKAEILFRCKDALRTKKRG